MKKLSKKSNKGFTLVELLVVIAIIGILAVVAVPSLFKNIEKGKIAELEADISAIRSAALSIYADKSAYPESMDEIKKEVESLGYPFSEEYILSTEEAPAELSLTIDTDKISDSGINKLKNDLGKDKVDSTTSGKIIVTLISSSN